MNQVKVSDRQKDIPPDGRNNALPDRDYMGYVTVSQGL